MFRLRNLKLYNFGPYYGLNEIEFEEDSGVILVWGENGDGKTSILNSLSYVLCDEILSRTRHRVSPAKFVNLRAVEEGGDMRVEVSLINDGSSYTIVRGLKRTGGDGKNISDYNVIFNMMKDNIALSNKESIETLARILPKDIARFYLFDAESMAEYEKLLDPQNEDGEKIKESIEDLLGLPILLNGRTILDSAVSEYSNARTRISKTNERCKRDATELEQTRSILSKNLQDKQTLEDKKNQIRERLLDIDSEIRQNNRYYTILKSIETNKEFLKKYQDEYDTLLIDYKSIVSKTWKNLIYSVAEGGINKYEQELENLQAENKNLSSAKLVLGLLKAFENKCECPVCKNQIPHEKYVELIEKYKAFSEGGSEESEKIEILQENLRKLRNIKEEKSIADIKKAYDALKFKKVDVDSYTSKVKDLENDLLAIGRSEEDESKNLPIERDTLNRKLFEIEQSIGDIARKIEFARTQIKTLEKKISQNGAGVEFDKATKRLEFVEALFNLFSDSIDLFRRELTSTVEKDASLFFRQITNRPDQYVGLEINNNFGLDIIHRDGSRVPNRSGGEEQIVAFSLINALHNNAPIDGPIIMDSTFQRIDGGHQSKSAKSLLTFNTQIVLLLYNDEIKNVEEFKNLFAGKLLHEYHLHKIDGDSYKSKID